MRPVLLALCLVVAAPALAQTPPPETFTFEGLPGKTPIPFVNNAQVPNSARIKEVRLASGGRVTFRTDGGADCAALVTVQGTTAIVGVGKKGKIESRRLLQIRLRKAKGARFDAFTPVNAGVRIDDKGTTDKADDEVFYDGPGIAAFRLWDADKTLFPITGNLLGVTRLPTTPFVPDPFDLTTTRLDFTRIEIATADSTPDEDNDGDPLVVRHMVYDDLVVSRGH
jgi:hypothetical protein